MSRLLGKMCLAEITDNLPIAFLDTIYVYIFE